MRRNITGCAWVLANSWQASPLSGPSNRSLSTPSGWRNRPEDASGTRCLRRPGRPPGAGWMAGDHHIAETSAPGAAGRHGVHRMAPAKPVPCRPGRCLQRAEFSLGRGGLRRFAARRQAIRPDPPWWGAPGLCTALAGACPASASIGRSGDHTFALPSRGFLAHSAGHALPPERVIHLSV